MANIIHMENGKLATTPFAAVEQLVGSAIDTGNVVVHFHGGLVNEQAGREIAHRLTPVYGAAGASPIFPVWEAGLFETIRNNLGEVAKEKLFRVVFKRVQKIAKRKFAQDQGGRDAGTVPVVDVTAAESSIDAALDNDDLERLPEDLEPDPGLTELNQMEILTLEAELEADPELQIVAQEVSQTLRDPADIAAEEAARSSLPVVASTATLMDPAAVDALVDRPDPSARGIFSALKIAKAIVKVAARVIKRYLRDRDHGFHATVVEETLRAFYVANVGGAIWGAMKGDTRDSFGPDPAVFGGTALLKVLGDRITAGDQVRVTLVGHSTGAVYIGHLLDAADNMLPGGFAFDVVLLAPAATFQLMQETLLRRAHRVAGLRMFTMTDDNEKADRLVPVLFPHSLLYFVSGVVEAEADMPLVGMERYYDAPKYPGNDFPAVEPFRRFIGADAQRVVWSVDTAGAPGLRTAALKHGDFDNEARTLESVQSILQNGL